MNDLLRRQRDATYRFWREDVSVRPGGECADLGGLQLHTTGLQPRHWNGAFLTRPMDVAAALPAVAAWFAERNKPWGLLIPAELDVAPAGLIHVHDQPVMLRSLTDLPPVDLGPLTVTADAPAADVALVQAEAFGDGYDLALAFVTPTVSPQRRPPQHTITAYDGADPVGCATVATMDGVAGVYGVSVREAWRRRGLGAALTARCLELAAADGCDLAYLNPSPLGHGMYASLGFRDALPFRIWVPN